MPIAPLIPVVASGVAEVVGAFPRGGKRRKFAARVLRGMEANMAELADMLDKHGESGTGMDPLATRLIGREIRGFTAMVDAVTDVLTGEDDDNPPTP